MAKKGAKSAAAPAPAIKSASVAAKPTSKSTKGKAPVPVVEPESEEDDEELDEEDWSDEDMEDSEDDAEDEDDEDDETGGVTESAMRKLMKALGDDGLDDIARAQLGEAEADDEEEEDDEEEGEGSDGEGSEEDEEMDSDVGEEETSTVRRFLSVLAIMLAHAVLWHSSSPTPSCSAWSRPMMKTKWTPMACLTGTSSVPTSLSTRTRCPCAR